MNLILLASSNISFSQLNFVDGFLSNSTAFASSNGGSATHDCRSFCTFPYCLLPMRPTANDDESVDGE